MGHRIRKEIRTWGRTRSDLNGLLPVRRIGTCRTGLWHAAAVRLIPFFVVDWLPLRWWRPGNLHPIGDHVLHLWDEDNTRSIEWDGPVVAQGRRLFPCNELARRFAD